MTNMCSTARCPLGLLNDWEHKVTFFLDKSFLDGSGLTGVHSNQIPLYCACKSNNTE